MPLFRISLVQTVIEGTSIDIEADDQESAEFKALDIAIHGARRDGAPLDWQFQDIAGDIEVVGAEKWPPVRGEPAQIWQGKCVAGGTYE